MVRRPPRSTRTDTLFPYTTLFRSAAGHGEAFRQCIAVERRDRLAVTGIAHFHPQWRERFAREVGQVQFVDHAPGTIDGHRHRRRRYLHVERLPQRCGGGEAGEGRERSEEHTSELQSLMRISYAVFCLKKKKTIDNTKELKSK